MHAWQVLAAFRLFDEDRSGAIDTRELRAALKVSTAPALPRLRRGSDATAAGVPRALASSARVLGGFLLGGNSNV